MAKQAQAQNQNATTDATSAAAATADSKKKKVVKVKRNPNHPFILKFKDGNRSNVSKENVELITIYDAIASKCLAMTNAMEVYTVSDLTVLMCRGVFESMVHERIAKIICEITGEATGNNDLVATALSIFKTQDFFTSFVIKPRTQQKK